MHFADVEQSKLGEAGTSVRCTKAAECLKHALSSCKHRASGHEADAAADDAVTSHLTGMISHSSMDSLVFV